MIHDGVSGNAGSSVGDRAREVSVVRVRGTAGRRRSDLLTVEEPLEFRVCQAGAAAADGERSVSVTMRTPGHDYELAAGFLFTEGFFEHPEELAGVRYCGREGNVVRATLATAMSGAAERGVDARGNRLVANSSCGVCGKASIEDVLATLPEPAEQTAESAANPVVPAAILHLLPAELRRHQRTFAQTGGLHAAALFDSGGTLRLLREDVGRHNALDKLIGRAVLEALPPLRDAVVLFSGRTGFELVQKAACAGIRFLAAVGAPSSLACDLAAELGITLVGFLRDGRFNIYAGAQRVTGVADAGDGPEGEPQEAAAGSVSAPATVPVAVAGSARTGSRSAP
jgi:FdhD protein